MHHLQGSEIAERLIPSFNQQASKLMELLESKGVQKTCESFRKALQRAIYNLFKHFPRFQSWSSLNVVRG